MECKMVDALRLSTLRLTLFAIRPPLNKWEAVFKQTELFILLIERADLIWKRSNYTRPNVMGLIKKFTTIFFFFALSACVFVPVVDRYEDASSCKTYTKSMSLKANQMNGACKDNGCLGGVLLLSAGSVLISGSIVLIGNTVHWLEYQGLCSDGYLNVTKQLFIESVNKPQTTPES